MEEVIVLASGASSRFWPLGQDRHKTLYPVGLGTTIFGATLVDLSRAGYKRIIVTARIGDVERMRKEVPETMDVFFIIQNEAKGQGDAILRAARCLREETFYLTTADKIYAGLLLDKLGQFSKPDVLRDAVLIATTPTDQPSLYGIVSQTESGIIKSIVEKPENWDKPDPRKIVSAYRLNKQFLRILKQTARQEYNFEATLDKYAKIFLAWSVPVEDMPETTFKYPWHLLNLNRLLMQNLAHNISSSWPGIESGAIIVPPVYIESGVTVSGSAVIRGPVVIREGAVIGDHTLIRDHSYIGKGVVIGAGSEVKNSIICDGTKLHDAHALDSIIDEDCRLGAGTRVSNSRFDRKDVTSVIKGKKVSTGMRHFGVVIGKGTHTATLANLMPGVKIGQNCRIGGSFAVTKDIPDNHCAYMDESGKVVIKPKQK